MVTLLLFLAAFGSSVISGVVGMGGGVTLLAVLTFLYPMNVIVPLHGATQFASNLSRALFLRNNVNWTVFRYFSIGAPIGGFFAFGLLRKMHHQEWVLLLIVGLLFYVSLKPKKLPDINLPKQGYLILGILAGFLGCLMGATGPLLAPFFARKEVGKEEIVATKASCQLVVHFIKFPIFLGLAFPYLDYAVEVVVMVLAVIFGTRLGTYFLGKVSRDAFQVVLKVVLFLSGVRILYKLI